MSQITSSDGRVVNFAYKGNSSSSVSNNAGRIWTYEYATSGVGQPLLTKVIRPDGASWQYDYEMGGTISNPGAFALGSEEENLVVCLAEIDDHRGSLE